MNNNLNAFQPFIKKPDEKKKVNKRIIGYTRVSSKDQLTNFSIEGQAKEIRDFAEKNNYVLEDILGGTYESASGDFTRKEFKRLYDAIKKSKNRPYAIAIKFINRFSRTGASAISIVDELVEKLNVHLIETSSGLNTENLNDRAKIYHKLLEAMEENQKRLEQTIPGMKAKLKAGDWLGNAPFGYTLYGPRTKDFSRRREIQELVINDDGELLKKAWQWKLQSERDCVILEKLESLGLHLNKQRLSDMWRKPVYCGIIVNKLIDKPVIGNWEPIVSPEDFLKINNMVTPAQGAVYKTNSINDDRPLARFVLCEKCNTQLTGYINKKKGVHYYKCNICNANFNAKTTVRSVNTGLNDSFKQFLGAIELKEDYAEHFKMQIEKIFNYMNAETLELQKTQNRRENELNKMLDNLQRRYAFGELDDKDLYQRYKSEIEKELAAIAVKYNNVNSDLSNHLKYLNNVALASKNLNKHWTLGDYSVKDKIQRAVFPEGVFIDPVKREYLTININGCSSHITQLI
jgi:site-specific DNA recombinase